MLMNWYRDRDRYCVKDEDWEVVWFLYNLIPKTSYSHSRRPHQEAQIWPRQGTSGVVR